MTGAVIATGLVLAVLVACGVFACAAILSRRADEHEAHYGDDDFTLSMRRWGHLRGRDEGTGQ